PCLERTLTVPGSPVQCGPFFGVDGRREEKPTPLSSTFDLLTLALLPGVEPRATAALALRGPLADVLGDPESHADILGPDAVSLLRAGGARRRAEEELRRASLLGVRIVGRDEPEFPALLRRIFSPPPVLYLRGRLDAEEGDRSVAIVGARACTPA